LTAIAASISSCCRARSAESVMLGRNAYQLPGLGYPTTIGSGRQNRYP
jgi:hypothetical protein